MVNTLSIKSLKSNADTGRTDAVPAAPEAAESTDSSKAGADNVADRSLNLVQSGDLKDVRNSMHMGGDAQKTGAMVAFDGANAPTIEADADKRGSLSAEIVPRNQDLFKTPVYDAAEFTNLQITKEFMKEQNIPLLKEAGVTKSTEVPQGKDAESKEALEGSEKEGESVQYDQSFDYEKRASVEIGKDGNSLGIIIRDGDVRYEFKSTPNGITRTRATDRGKEEVQFDAAGKPVAKHILRPDADEVETEPVNPKDTMTVSQGSNDDIVLTTKDTERNTEISVVFGQDGVVKFKQQQQPLEKGSSSRVTKYAADGSVELDTEEKYDESGRKVERVEQTSDKRVVERFDAKGKVVDQTTYGEGFLETVKYREDGIVQKERDTRDGKRYGVIEQPDGSKVEAFSDSVNFVNQIKTIGKDGSYTISQEDKIGSSYQVGDASGNWMSVKTPRNSNLSIISRGNGNDVYEERIQQGL